MLFHWDTEGCHLSNYTPCYYVDPKTQLQWSCVVCHSCLSRFYRSISQDQVSFVVMTLEALERKFSRRLWLRVDLSLNIYVCHFHWRWVVSAVTRCRLLRPESEWNSNWGYFGNEIARPAAAANLSCIIRLDRRGDEKALKSIALKILTARRKHEQNFQQIIFTRFSCFALALGNHLSIECTWLAFNFKMSF